LDRFLDGAQDAGAQVEKLVAAWLKIAGCSACERCFETGECAIHDDFQSVAAKLLFFKWAAIPKRLLCSPRG